MTESTGPQWVKSTFSNNGGNCVEGALVDGEIWVRDSKHPESGNLRFTPAEWKAFLDGVGDGQMRFGL